MEFSGHRKLGKGVLMCTAQHFVHLLQSSSLIGLLVLLDEFSRAAADEQESEKD